MRSLIHGLGKALLLGAVGLTVASCKKDGPTPPPPDPVPTSIRITPASPGTLDAIGATVQLTAAVLDQTGNPISGLSVTWSTGDATIADVSAMGVVTAVANGSTAITASSGSISGNVSVTVAQTASAIAKVGGDGQTDEVGTLLGTALTGEVTDRLGNAMAGVDVNFAPGAGNGTVSSAAQTSDAGGQVSVMWTLGLVAGPQEVVASLADDATVTAVFSAEATAAAADSMFVQAGDAQSGLVNAALQDSVVVKVVDAFDNGVPGVAVQFATSDGAVSPTDATTDDNGEAAASWTLGGSEGVQQAEATSAGLKGSPVTFTASGGLLSLSGVSPDPLVEGGTATLSGTGFDAATPANNVVTIDGVAATVTAATSTSLTVTVPVRDCRPADDVEITVTVGGAGVSPVTHRLDPASTLSLAVGEQAIVRSPSDFCLQFLEDAAGGDAYLIGVSSTAEINGTMPFSLVALDGIGAAPPVASAVWQPAVAGGPAITAEQEEQLRWLAARHAAERRLREWELEFHNPVERPTLYSQFTSGGVVGAAVGALAVPSEGDLVPFRVPNALGNLCDYTEITTEIRAVGTSGIIAVDTSAATLAGADSLTDAEIASFSSTFDADIFPELTSYFGALNDLDTNARVIMVLTPEVNVFGGIAGFVTSADLADRAQCASSDFGEIFYGYVPDPGGAAGPNATPQSHDAVVNNMLPLIAHEVTHNIQQSRRVGAGLGFLASWESEGQADLAKEIVAHRIFGNAPGNDYGPTEMNGPGGTGTSWYEQRFLRLSLYFGWQGGNNRAADAPETCSIFGYSNVPCLSSYFYGSGWAWHRYLSDRFGPSYASSTGTGETALQQDWIGKTLTSVAGIEDLLGIDFDDVFPEFAAALYADGRVSGLPAALQMTSWDLAGVYASFGNSILSLAPDTESFAAFSQSREVMGGSTAYTLVTAAGARGALAVRLRDQSDGILSGTMQPSFWILRTN